MKKIYLLSALLALCACDNGELAEAKRELKANNCAISLPSTCEKFLAQSEKEINERMALLKDQKKFEEYDNITTYSAKLKKQHGDKLCESQDYADVIAQYETLVDGYNHMTSFGVLLKDRGANCIEPLKTASKLCGSDSATADFEELTLSLKNTYAKYLEMCNAHDVYKQKLETLKKDVAKEKNNKCKRVSFCGKDLTKGCVTTLPLNGACLTTAKVVFTDDKHGGVFVQPRNDSVSTNFANGFIQAFGLGETVACRDVYFIKTKKQFFSEDRVALSGYWRYVGPYEYREGSAERTTKAFERAEGMSDAINALCGGNLKRRSSSELESLMRIMNNGNK